MIFLQTDAVPNTVNYMIAGYAVIFSALGLYLFSLVIRTRNAHRDLEMMRELEEKEAKQISTETQRAKRESMP